MRLNAFLSPILALVVLAGFSGCTDDSLESPGTDVDTITVGSLSVSYPSDLSVKQNPTEGDRRFGEIIPEALHARIGSDDGTLEFSIDEYTGITIEEVYTYEVSRFQQGAASADRLDDVVEGTGQLFSNATIREPQRSNLNGRDYVLAGFELSNGVAVSNLYISLRPDAVGEVSVVLTDELYRTEKATIDYVMSNVGVLTDSS